MSDQLSILDYTPDADVEPVDHDPDPLGPNDFHIPPFGRVRIPVLTSTHDEAADRLFGLVDEARSYSRQTGIYSTFCEMWLAALRRYEGGESDYMEIVDDLDREVVELATQGFAVLRHHFVDSGYLSDLLGQVFMRCRHEWGGGWADQEFTPWSVCRLMAADIFDDIDPDRLDSGPPVSIHDPACGSGSMLLAVRALVAECHGRRALRYLRCYGQDISHLCCTMARIQLRLSNAPWALSLLAATHAEMARQRQESHD